jgi:hypothetical protein
MSIEKDLYDLHRQAGRILDDLESALRSETGLTEYLDHVALATDVAPRGRGVDILLAHEPMVWIEVRSDRVTLRGNSGRHDYEHTISADESTVQGILDRHLMRRVRDPRN